MPLAPDLDVTADLPAAAAWDRMAVLYSAVSQQVADAVRDGAGLPVVQSGDCTTSLGIVAGLQRTGADPGVVWFDAHGDVQTLETSTSGYLGGLPLRLLAGYRPELIADALGLRAVPEDRIVLAGARDLDPPEVQYLAGAAIRRRQVTDLTVADLPDGPLYVHLDVDVLDPGGLPGLILPVPGGPGTAPGRPGAAHAARLPAAWPRSVSRAPGTLVRARRRTSAPGSRASSRTPDAGPDRARAAVRGSGVPVR